MKSKSRNKPQIHSSGTESSSDDFAFKPTKIAVSQICQSVGFRSTQLSALEILTQAATLYLKTLAKSAASYSNAANRTEPNLLDIINALHDIFSVQGFRGASTLHTSNNCLLSSSVLKEISDFVNSTDEIPFAKHIPCRNSIPPPPQSLKYLDSELESRGMHIPRWLPGFPHERTYKKCEEKERYDKRNRGGCALWEDSELVRRIRIGNENGAVKEKKKNVGSGGDLGMERGRVRFKIGEVGVSV